LSKDDEDDEDDKDDKDDKEDDEEEERRTRQEAEEKEEATDIKSNNPHLAGGEKHVLRVKSLYSNGQNAIFPRGFSPGPSVPMVNSPVSSFPLNTRCRTLTSHREHDLVKRIHGDHVIISMAYVMKIWINMVQYFIISP